MKMQSVLLVLLGAWTLQAGAVPSDDPWRYGADRQAAGAATRAADDRSWYGQATGSDGSFAQKPPGAPEMLALDPLQSPIPEPSTWAMVGGGLGWVLLLGWRRRRGSKQ